MSRARYLLWDFGDTLVDERWMWPCPAGVAGWTECYRTLGAGDLGSRWNRGELSFEEFAAQLARKVGMSLDAASAHMRRCCREIEFFEHAWTTARAHALPQAIVTVNPDLFSRFVAPEYGLDTIFDTIATSWQEGTDDKARLCEIALERLGGREPSEGLLIDNIEANVDAWRALGGQAHWFRSDEEFARDAARLLATEDA